MMMSCTRSTIAQRIILVISFATFLLLCQMCILIFNLPTDSEYNPTLQRDPATSFPVKRDPATSSPAKLDLKTLFVTITEFNAIDFNQNLLHSIIKAHDSNQIGCLVVCTDWRCAQRIKHALPFCSTQFHPVNNSVAANNSYHSYGSEQFNALCDARADILIKIWTGIDREIYDTMIFMDNDMYVFQSIIDDVKTKLHEKKTIGSEYPYRYDAIVQHDSQRCGARFFATKNYCGCFLGLNLLNMQSLLLLQSWSKTIVELKGSVNDQMALRTAVKNFKHRVYVLDCSEYANGYNMENYAGISLDSVKVIHANWRVGGRAKREFLQQYNAWSVPRSLNAAARNSSWNSHTLYQCLNFINNVPDSITASFYDRAFDHTPSEYLDEFYRIYQKTQIFHDNDWQMTYNGYEGPWIENYWIDTFSRKALQFYVEQDFIGYYQTFSVFIPIFVKYNDLPFVEEFKREPCKPGHILLDDSFLRPDFVYITVVQHADGIYILGDKCKNKKPRMLLETRWKTNVVVLSSGGVGNVPLPLLQRDLSVEVDHERNNSSIDNQFLLGFAGSLVHGEVRKPLINGLRDVGAAAYENAFLLFNGTADKTSIYENWVDFYANCCRYSLVPRGYGRTAFMFSENLQLNKIPVYVWTDFPWIPYWHLQNNFSINLQFAKNATFYHRIYQALHAMSNDPQQYYAVESFIKNNKETYFTYNGVMKQIQMFMKNPPYHPVYNPQSHTMLSCFHNVRNKK